MMNVICLNGRLTADPELKNTANGVPVCSFTIAVDRNIKGKDGEKQTDFINCVAWRNTAEFVSKYFGKGKMIAIVGELQSRKYTDKDGNNRTAFEVLANQVNFCGGNNDRKEETTSAAAVQSFPKQTIYDDDALPF